MGNAVNRIYKTIWNEQLGTFVAVSENAKARGKRSGSSLNATGVQTDVQGMQAFALKLCTAILFAAGLLGFFGAAQAAIVLADSTNPLEVDGSSIDFTTGPGSINFTNGGTITGLTGASVANGSTAAVNGGQLYMVNQSMAAALGGGANVNASTGAFSGPTYTLTGGSYSDVGSALTNLQGQVTAAAGTASQGWNLQANGGTAQKIAPGEAVNFVNGSNTTVTRTGQQIKVDVASSPVFSGTVKTSSLTVDNNATVGGTLTVTGQATLNGGLNMGGQKITNVAGGSLTSGSTEAVNGGQMYDLRNELFTAGTGAKYFRANSTKDDSKAEGDDSVAIGPLAIAKERASTAIGLNAKALGESSIALGEEALVYEGASSSIALGKKAQALATGATAIGEEAQAAGGSTAIGHLANASASAVAIGQSAFANTDSVALGQGAKASLSDSVSIGTGAGAGSVAQIPGDKLNIAIGSNSGTDVVGGYNIAVGNMAGSGVTGRYGVAVGQFAGNYITGSNNVAIGYKANGSEDSSNAVAVEDAVSLGRETRVISNSGVALGTLAKVSSVYGLALGASSSVAAGADSAVALGQGAVATHSNGVALGANSVTVRPVLPSYITNVAAPGSAVSVGGGSTDAFRRISNVAAGAENSDAVNVSQLKAAQQGIVDVLGTGFSLNDATGLVAGNIVVDGTTYSNVESALAAAVRGAGNPPGMTDAVIYDGASKTTVTLQGTGGTRLENVADGRINAASLDAVNGRQLQQVEQKISEAKVKFVSINSDASADNNGNNDGASGEDAVAIGKSSSAAGMNSTALGTLSKAGADGVAGATAIGYNARATGKNSSALGIDSEADLEGAVAIGYGSASHSKDAVAIGTNAKVELSTTNGVRAVDGVAIGTSSLVNKEQGIAVGSFSRALADQAMALGTRAHATAGSAIAMGVDSGASAADSLALGTRSNASAVNGIAMGIDSKSLAKGGIAFGELATAGVIVPPAEVGMLPKVYGDNGIAIGKGTLASTENGVALGTSARAGYTAPDAVQGARKNMMALGNGSVALAHNSVALGAGSATKESYADTTARYSNVGNEDNVNGIISVGRAAGDGDMAGLVTRRITNLAGGMLDTDAVNVKQLRTVRDTPWSFTGNSGTTNQTIESNLQIVGANTGTTSAQNVKTVVTPATHTVNANGDVVYTNGKIEIQFAETPTFKGADMSGSKITRVGAGTVGSASTDAINGSQLYNLAGNVSNIFGGNSNNTNGTITFTNIGDTGQTTIHEAIKSVNTTANAGWNVTANGAGSTLANVGPNGRVTFNGDSNVTVVQAGVDDAGVVNVALNKNLDLSATGSVKTGNTTLNNTGLTITGGPSVTAAGINAGSKVITNVAAGELGLTSTEAVNGSQLFATNSTIANIAGDTNTTYTDANGMGIRYVRTNEAGLTKTDAFAQAAGSTAVGYEARATAGNALALGRNTNASHAGSVALGANSIASGLTLGATAYAVATGTPGYTPIGEVSVGSAGAERRITNLAAGANATDAVNVSQLKQVASNVTELDDRVVKYDGVTGAPKTTITLGGAASTDGGLTNGTKITNLAQGDISALSTDAVNGSQLFATNSIIANIAGDTSTTYTDTKGMGIRYVRTNETGLPQSDAFAQALGATAVGYNAISAGENAVAIGRNATANGNNSTALGQGAVTNGDFGTAIGGGDATDPAKLNSAGRFGTAVGFGSQANGVGDTAMGTFANTGAVGGPDAGYRTAVGYKASATGEAAASLGSFNSASGARSLALGYGTNVSADDSVALGSNSVANGSTLTGIAYLSNLTGSLVVGLTPIGEVSIGKSGAERRVTNVAAGAMDTDAVNVSQLKQVAGSVTELGNRAVKYDLYPDNSVNYTSISLGGPVSIDGGVTGGTKITNLAQGDVSELSTDAVNGAQLYALNTQINNGSVGMFQVYQPHSGTGPSPTGVNSAAGGVGAAASGANSVAVGNGSQATADNSTALGTNAQAKQAGDVALGYGSVADRGAESYTGKYSGAQNDTAGTVSVGAPGAERTISNVADGKEATDAVNLRQLDGAVLEAKNYTDTQINNVVGSITTGATGMFQVSQDNNAPQPTVSGTNSAAGGAGATASGSNSTAVGNDARASGNNSTAMGNGAQAIAEGSVALGQGSVADRANTVSVGSKGAERQIVNVANGEVSATSTDAVNGSQLHASNTNIQNVVDGKAGLVQQQTNNAPVTIANHTGGTVVNMSGTDGDRRITGVANGQADNDAVNMGQLNSLGQGMSNQVGRLDGRINKVENRANAGVAAALATAGLPQAYLPGKSMFSLGGGTWNGETGYAMGLSTVSDNGKWVLKGTASSSSRGDYGGSVGVGYQW